MLYYSYVTSPLGTICLREAENALTGLHFIGQRFFPALPDDSLKCETILLRECRIWLEDYFNGRKPSSPDFSIAPEGSLFRQKVWNELLKIPYGSTVSYGHIAKSVESSPRAVGGAVGHNPVSILIPCHRVIPAGGSLGNYAAGEKRKRFLLSLEGVSI